MHISSPLLQQLNSQLPAQENIAAPFLLDGKFYHYKKGFPEPSSSHIWVIGASWEFKGNTYQWVKCGDWRSDSSFLLTSYDSTKITKKEREYAAKQIETAQKTANEIKLEQHKLCIKKWEPIFRELPVASEPHPYIKSKKLSSNYRGRIRNNSTLLIPIENEKGFVGVQQIFEADGKMVKYFSKGIEIKGSWSTITNFDLYKTKTIYLCEGYATGASVYEATKKPVVVCFNCNNIIPVIAKLKKINKSIRIIICADDDHETMVAGKLFNAGKYKASLASKQFSNTIFKLPTFEDKSGLSDFNDLHVTEGIDKLKKQVTYSNSDFISITPLGHKNQKYYYVNSQTSEIFSLTPAAHSPDNLMAQAPRKYWGQKYGYIIKNDSPTSTPDWDLVKETLFDVHREIGFFEDDKIRGIGGWIDNNHIIFNSGKYLYIDSEKFPISEHDLKTDFIYEAKKSVSVNPKIDLDPEIFNNIYSVFSQIKYKNPADYIYLIGTIVLAQTPALWDWRSHMWITGSRGTGKSTILHWINNLVFTNNIGIIENATSAGIRGEIDSSAISVILDEAEAGTIESKKRMSQIMELARQSSSNTGSRALRGTSTGESVSFLLNSLFILGSIQTSLNNAADISRFTVIDLEKGNPEDFKSMSKTAQHFPDYKLPLLSWTAKNANLIRSNQAVIRDELISYNSSIDSRQADQLSWPIAAYYTLKNQKQVEPIYLDPIFMMLNVSDSEYITSNQSDDENDCINAILDIETSEKESVYKLIINQSDELQKIGMRVLGKVSDTCFEVFIHSKNPKLKRALELTEFHDYAKILRRLPECIKQNTSQRVGGTMRKGLLLRIEISNSLGKAENDSDGQIDVPF